MTAEESKESSEK